MDIRRFVDEAIGSWQALERLLDRMDRPGLGPLGPDDVRELSRLYRKASADLVLLRGLRVGADVVLYLEALVARAYAVIHAPESRSLRAFGLWFVRGFPDSVHRHRHAVILAALLLFGSAALAFLATALDPQAFDFLLPSEFAGGYAERQDDPLAARFSGLQDGGAAIFSAELFERNVRASLLAFAAGISAGLGTVMVLVQNGVVLGAIGANFFRWGQQLQYLAMVAPHGVTEIFALVIAGGGGFVLAGGLLRPGPRSRGLGLRLAGESALPLVGMVIPLLAVSAAIEAWVTPLRWLPELAKLAFALLLAVALVVWILPAWVRGRTGAPPTALLDSRPFRSPR